MYTPIVLVINVHLTGMVGTLVALYFTHMNDLLPLLHRPTFEAAVRDGVHLHDEGFGSTVLLVCANGARFATMLPSSAMRGAVAPLPMIVYAALRFDDGCTVFGFTIDHRRSVA